MTLLSLWMACVPEKPEGNDAPPINTGHEPADCDVDPEDACAEAFSCNAPTITDLVVSEGDLLVDDSGTYPTVRVAADVEDVDGDLHNLRISVWYDVEVDGSVDTTVAGTASDFVQMQETDCHTFMGGLSLEIGVNGADPLYDTQYEFAAVAYDAYDSPSEPKIAVGTTPSAL